MLVAIRPEKISLVDERRDGDGNAIEGILDDAAYLGDRSHFHVLIPGREQSVAVAVQNMERPAPGLAESDQPVWLSFSGQSVVLLRPDS